MSECESASRRTLFKFRAGRAANIYAAFRDRKGFLFALIPNCGNVFAAPPRSRTRIQTGVDVNRRRSIYAAFLLSGVAGLVYEVLWTRYLGLFVGHSAYAQVLVLAVYLGGMAVGALAVSDVSSRARDPLRWYARVEIALGVAGLLFHWLFMFATDLSHDVLFPAVGSASWVGSVRWAVAGALILPQAVLLGTTFPLMAAGLVREDSGHPGGSVARAYLLNTLGGAAGVLLAGFVFVDWFGLPGTAVAAGALNLGAAALVLRALRGPQAESSPEVREPATVQPGIAPSMAASSPQLPVLLLVVAFGTAVASFAYEIGWIRMLSLVLGSATHAFELMLSAFILGIALGAWVIRKRSDETADPVGLLGSIQVGMGLTALLSLPLYLLSFGAMANMIQAFSGEPAGYMLFNIGRYGLCLLVMLPSTVLAGATLPLITGALIRSGAGERAIGRVYGVNTIGSVVGAGAAGLIGLPLLGLEGLVAGGAALDVLLGVVLLERAGVWSRSGRRRAALAVGLSATAFVTITGLVEFDPTTITSGVYRRGDLTERARWRSLFYADGRTATVSAHIGTDDGVIVLATNGKPDASLGPRWIMEGRDTLKPLPVPTGRDFTTQVLAPIVGLAHNAEARAIANVGHGSGMTASSFLTSGNLERLVTIEIEPLMVEGSLVFLPANGPAFADPRVSYVFDDAKSFFSYRQERFDIIFAEPSNPWVSGTASLFTEEFYQRVIQFLSEGGVLTQWMQIYEIDDDLFLSVLAALDAVFPSYRAYLVGDADVAIVASLDPDMGDPDWSVVETETFAALTTGAPPFLAQHMEASLLFDQNTFRAVLNQGVQPNSDFHPVLDLGAERTRFEQQAAEGVYSFAVSRVDLTRHLSNRPLERHSYATPPAYSLASVLLTERGAWLREAVEVGGGLSPEEFPEWDEDLVHLQTFFLLSSADVQVGSWETWAGGFVRAENAQHWGTSGWTDSTFYGNVYSFLERAEAPSAARAAVDLMNGYALADWSRVADAADRLVPGVSAGERWVPPDLLLDVAVLAYLETGRPEAARNAIAGLMPRTGRVESNLRNRLLRALVDEADR
jgi:predicted membrane-bound spermidine synthase